MGIQPVDHNSRSVDPVGPSAAGGPVRRASASEAPSGVERQDAIELSEGARDVLRLDGDAAERARLVARLRQQVDAGTYRPDPDAIARRLAEQGGL
jgi:anti-sigma28 factor (negative regulator of flagellin synthesis)